MKPMTNANNPGSVHLHSNIKKIPCGIIMYSVHTHAWGAILAALHGGNCGAMLLGMCVRACVCLCACVCVCVCASVCAHFTFRLCIDAYVDYHHG